MPPYKLPRSLFKIALAYVEALLSLSCRNIEKTYGNYSEYKCQQQVVVLQDYLLSNIPGMVLDEVFEVHTANMPKINKQDLRITLALYMHSNMRKFSIHSWPVGFKFDLDNAFWVERLMGMGNLVVLDLHLICTDEILRVVGTNCHKLQQINIVSKWGRVHTMNQTHESFNALKLKFFVSDVGLSYLCNCKLLKKVMMNKILRSHLGGCMMTVAGIRALVKSLPHLQNITYDDMGLVISEQMEDVQQLQLTHLSDYHPRPTHIAAAEQFCCNLQHLCLCFPHQTSVCSATDILESLSKSNLRVPVLELIHFPICIEMTHLLDSKGSFLRSLLIDSIDYISLRAIQLIGQACPGLRNLHLKQLLGDDKQLSSLEICGLFNTRLIFHNLRCLYLGGWNWNPAEVLPLFLLHAKQLETLSVVDTFRQKYQDDVIASIISSNPLQELKHAHILTGQILSITTISYFIKHCPKLREISFVRSANISSTQVKELCDEVHQKNLDLKIYTVEMNGPVT